MTDLLDLRNFDSLSDAQKAAALEGFGVLARLAVSYTRPVLFGRTPDDTPTHTASGFIVILDEPFLVTAGHVLDEYEKEVATDPTSPFQFGGLSFSPVGRRIAVDKLLDIAVVSLAGLDIGLVRARPYRPAPGEWPPPQVDATQDSVIISGLPIAFRSYPRANDVEIGAYPLIVPVARVGEGYFLCRVEDRGAIVGPGDDGLLHDPGKALFAMSGGPVLRLGRGQSYPIVGVMSQYLAEFDLIRIAHLGGVRAEAWRSSETTR